MKTPLVRLIPTACLAIASMAHASGGSSPAKPTQQMQDVLTELDRLGGKPIDTLSAEEARKQPSPTDAVLVVENNRGIHVDRLKGLKEVRDLEADGATAKVAARIYVPEGDLPKSAILYFHGGGWVIGDIDTYDATPRALARRTGAIVISADYRKGPEVKFPAAHDDAFATYKWLLDHASEYGVDTKRIAIVGESAGGNLALNVAIAARDQNVQAPVASVLIYPVAGADMDTDSYKLYSDAKPLNRDMMKWFFSNYLNSKDDAKDTRIDLVNANLHNLPPTLVITAQIDPLRSEGELLSQRLRDQGVKSTYQNYNGVTHEFFGMADVLDVADTAQSSVVSMLQESFR